MAQSSASTQSPVGGEGSELGDMLQLQVEEEEEEEEDEEDRSTARENPESAKQLPKE